MSTMHKCEKCGKDKPDGQIHEYDAADKAEKNKLVSQNPDYQLFENPVNTFISYVSVIRFIFSMLPPALLRRQRSI